MPKVFIAVKKEYTITLWALPAIHKVFYSILKETLSQFMRATSEIKVKTIL